MPDWYEEWDEEWVEDIKLNNNNNYEEGFESFLRHAASPPSACRIRCYGHDLGGHYPSDTLAPSEKRVLKVVRTQSPTKNKPSKSTTFKYTGVVERKEKSIFVLGPVPGEWKDAEDIKPTLNSETNLTGWIDLEHTATADAYRNALLEGKAVNLGPDLRVPFKVVNIRAKRMSNYNEDLDTANRMDLSHTAFQRPNDSYHARLWRIPGEIEEASALQPVQYPRVTCIEVSPPHPMEELSEDSWLLYL